MTNIFADKELEQDAVVRKYRTTAADGKNYQVLHYNLDVIIALGYRVQFEIYREREMRLLESDFDKAVKRLKNLNEDADSSEKDTNSSCYEN